MLIDLLLLVLILLVLGIALTAIMHAILHVPYVPTPAWVARKMIEAARLTGKEHVYDLGAGDGRLLLIAKKMHPGIRAIGCEIVPTVWLLGMVRNMFAGFPITLRLHGALSQNLRDADVVLLYVTPSLLKKLLPKFRAELKEGTRIVSHTFMLPGINPDERLDLTNGRRQATVFVYRWKKTAA